VNLEFGEAMKNVFIIPVSRIADRIEVRNSQVRIKARPDPPCYVGILNSYKVCARNKEVQPHLHSLLHGRIA
jgi:hypothetical protein